MSEILFERAAGSAQATVLLNRPDKRNALTLGMWRALEQAFNALEQDESLRCIVVRGAGGNFAAGADLSEFATLRATADQAEAYGRAMIAALTAVRDCRHPTIAAIEGLCVGGGLEIALMCDLRLGAADSRYGIPIQKVGVAMPYPELALLTQMLGRPTMLALLLEGQLHDASWAERHGLRVQNCTSIWRPIWPILSGASWTVRRCRIAITSASRGWRATCFRRSIPSDVRTLLRGRGIQRLPGRNCRFPRAARPEIPWQLKHLDWTKRQLGVKVNVGSMADAIGKGR